MDESSEYRSEAIATERKRTASAQSHTLNWQVLAVLGTGFLLGVPFVATGTIHAAWAQLYHMYASLRH